MEIKKAQLFLIALIFFLSVCSRMEGAFFPQKNTTGNENTAGSADAIPDKEGAPGLQENRQDKNSMPAGKRGFITTQRGLSEEERDIIDIKPLEKIERDYRKILLIAGIVILLISLLLLAYFYYKKRRKKEKVPVLIPAHELALQEFRHLKEKKLLESGELRQYYFALSEIFRRYLERRFSFPAIERTSEEIIPLLKQTIAINDEFFSLGREFLLKTDLVKFAKYFPLRDETEGIENNFLEFVEETKEEERLNSKQGK